MNNIVSKLQKGVLLQMSITYHCNDEGGVKRQWQQRHNCMYAVI